MLADDIKDRLHGALLRRPKATEDDVEAVAVMVMAVIGELTAELAVVIADVLTRIEVLEAKA